jgi:hypothetical protein
LPYDCKPPDRADGWSGRDSLSVQRIEARRITVEQERQEVTVEVTEDRKRKKAPGESVGAALSSFVESLEAALVGRGNAVMVRVNDAALEKLDMLIASSICKSRSEAAAFLLQRGFESSAALFDRVASVTNQITDLRQELLASVREPEA